MEFMNARRGRVPVKEPGGQKLADLLELGETG